METEYKGGLFGDSALKDENNKIIYEVERFYCRKRRDTDKNDMSRINAVKDGTWWKYTGPNKWWESAGWEEIDTVYSSMEECIRAGATADDCAKNHNGW